MASDKNHLYVVPNKNRLYVTVYPSDDAPDDKESFSWGFLIGPKHEDKVINPGMRYYVERVHAQPTSPGEPGRVLWRYAEDALPSIKCPRRMYARILIAKIEDEDRLERVMRETMAPPPHQSVGDDPVAAAARDAYDSQVWVAEVLGKLAALDRRDRKTRVVGTAVLDWRQIERTARLYVADKMANDRYNEAYLRETEHLLPKPTWDMLLDKETAG